MRRGAWGTHGVLDVFGEAKLLSNLTTVVAKFTISLVLVDLGIDLGNSCRVHKGSYLCPNWMPYPVCLRRLRGLPFPGGFFLPIVGAATPFDQKISWTL